MLWASFLPFEAIKVKIDSFSMQGSADIFSVSIFEQIVFKLRLTGIALILTCGLLYLVKSRIHQYVYNLSASFSYFIKEISGEFIASVRKEDRVHLLSLFIILIIAVAIRMLYLFEPILRDEAYTFVNFAQKPLLIGLSYYSTPNNHLFNTFLVHMSYLFFGNELWAIRLPAFIAGVLMVPVSYLAIRIFFNKYAALLTAGIIASSPVLVTFSTSARGYTLIGLIFLLIFILAVKLKQSENTAAWILFSALSAIGFYTIPIMIYPYGIVIVWLFYSIMVEDTDLSRKALLRKLAISISATVVLTFLLYAPVFAVSGFKSVVANRWSMQKSWPYFFENIIFTFKGVWSHWNAGIPSVIRFLLIAGFFTSLVYYKRLSAHRAPIILAVAIWCIFFTLVHRVIEFPRMWHFLLPVYFGLASAGVCYLLKPLETRIKQYRTLIFPISILALSLWLSLYAVQIKNGFFAYDPICPERTRGNEQIAVFIKDYIKPGDRVLDPTYRDAPLIYYFERYGIPVKYFTSDLDSSTRILVIVNEQRKTVKGELNLPISGIISKNGLSGDKYGPPELIGQFELAKLYEIKRLND